MKTWKLILATATVALGVATPAAALPVLGGLNIAGGPGPVFKASTIYENVIIGSGQTLAGYGIVTQINGSTVGASAATCIGCELTFQFGGFTSKNFVAGSPGSVQFDGGWVNFYLGFGADADFNPFTSGSSAADIVAATNGTLFLTLSGHPTMQGADTAVLFATGLNFGSGTDLGSGSGLMDVDFTGSANGNLAGAGGIANSNFDTNSRAANLGGPADFSLTSAFGIGTPPHPSECTPLPFGPSCLVGTAGLQGLVIPEPGTLALLGFALAGLGVLRRKKS